MMESGFCSPRAEKFPSGLRVLVVDDDLTWLKILEKMLKKCSYEVTTCCLARDALNLLRDRKDGFDLVISDVNMPDMDGFKLLEHVGLEMDLPVIMMSVDGETSRVMKGVQHGACDYLLKPIRMKELSNIWQHVMRKKIHEAKDTEYYDCMGNIQLMKNISDDFYDAYVLSGGSSGAVRKRKDVENKRHDDQESADTSSSSSKKARVVWCVDLHQKFVDAVNQIGFDKIGPKKILDAMNVPGLTRENVASHLQKFRQYLDRLEKEKELKAPIGGIKQENFPSGDHPGNFCLQNSFAMDQNNAGSDNFRHAKPKVNVDEMGTKEGDLNGGMISFLPAKKLKNPFTNDVSDHQKASIGPQIDPTHSTIKSFDQNYRFQPHGLTIPTQQWDETPMMQFKQQPNQEPKPYSLLEDNYSTQLFSPDHHFQANFQHPIPVDIKTSMPLSENSGRIEFPMRSTISSLPLTSENQILNPEAFKATSTVTPEMKIQMVDPHCIDNWTTPVQQKIIAGEPAWEPSLEENIQSLLQEYARAENIEYQNYYLNSGLMAELQTNYHDELGLYCDKLHDPIGSPFVDQGLFIV